MATTRLLKVTDASLRLGLSPSEIYRLAAVPGSGIRFYRIGPRRGVRVIVDELHDEPRPGPAPAPSPAPPAVDARRQLHRRLFARAR